MKTVTIQIGNSDDKLAQGIWAGLVAATADAIVASGVEVHFHGAPPNWTAWQNVAWVVVGNEEQLLALKKEVGRLRRIYEQNSAAWTEGKTEFI